MLARLRRARFGEMPRIAAAFGLSVSRVHYLRHEILGLAFTAGEREAYYRSLRVPAKPPQRTAPPKREGLPRQEHILDWTPAEHTALARLRREQAAERADRPKLIAQAKTGVVRDRVSALLILHRRYRLRLPLVEEELPSDARGLLPWLKKGDPDER